jgi:hypothetical protein
MARKPTEYKPGMGGKRQGINFDEKDLARIDRIKKHLADIGIDPNDTAAVKRALYIYDKLLTTGISTSEEL